MVSTGIQLGGFFFRKSWVELGLLRMPSVFEGVPDDNQKLMFRLCCLV